jgi:hypothetical protein
MERSDSGNLQATTKELSDVSEMKWSVYRGKTNNIPRSLLCNYYTIKMFDYLLYNLLHTIICDTKSKTGGFAEGGTLLYDRLGLN